jgi:GT2 family glycosyltransferase/2-polyprenyl-3-methyl-5-hydroxy-6-metoxy-1,4-benzoquinol methylase/glycosyltransferase involved in cell wall biosynthesis
MRIVAALAVQPKPVLPHRDNHGMTDTPADLHVYLRNINPDERTSLTVLAGLITRPHAAVLDLGCGSGALGQYLTQTRPCVVDGLTWSPAEAQHAQAHYRRVEVADLELVNLTELFAGCTYDYIVCADVLEHLRQPERVLAACRSLLSPGGKLLISVPNAGYAGLVAELLQGEFKYRDEGLLDRTHLRFFTRKSLQRFMGDNRWALDGLELVERPLPESEFRTPFDSLPPAVSRFLLHTPDALTYQFIASASPSDLPIQTEDTSAPGAPAHALFTAQLYVAHDGAYHEAHKISCAGHIGQTRQTLRFAIQDPGKRITKLRLDPADRPGFFHLHAIRLVHPEKGNLWTWNANSPEHLHTTPHAQIVWQTLLPGVSDATMLLLTGEDPWLELPLPRALLQTGIDGCTLEVDAGWPMSADYWALSSQVRPLQDQIMELGQHHAQVQASLSQALETTQQSLDQITSNLATTQATLQESQAHAAEQSQLLQTLKRDRSQLQTQLEQNQLEFAQLAQHLRTIENSTVFRATRPIVHAKMRLDRLLGRNPAHATPALAAPQPMTPNAHPVDVIVPIYRGLHDTKTCIESVLASTCNSAMRLIAINDASPEPEVTQWLRDKAAQEPRLTLLENTQNLGFVGTVNRGMALSETNDVLLLNSDTEVANDWLDRIRRAAYSDQKVASVTPFSNNATICSYPRFCKDNALPQGTTTAQLDQLCAQTNPGAVVDVPTGIGFCMYIRRDCLQAVGLFDEEHFGKGYGEENDFCQRAADAGWRNLHALDTFVLHTGGVSFGESKSPREQAAMETLRRLHPRYEGLVHRFLQQDPAQPYRLALDIARIAAAQKPVVLAVSHDRAGGTLRHAQELGEHLQDKASFFLLTPAPQRHVEIRLVGKNEGFLLRLSLDTQYNDLLDLLRKLGVQHIHYHHLLGHGDEVKQLPERLGVTYDFTAHDFYSYCPQISLTDHNNQYCGEEGLDQCRRCLKRSPAPGGISIEAWRDHHAEFLNNARNVLVPSADAAQRFVRFVPKANVRVAPHTDIPANTLLPAPQPRPLSPQGTLKIAVIGAMSTIKGADVLENVALAVAQQQSPLEFHLLGYGYRKLQTQPRARLTVHGEYAEQDLPQLLAWLQPDVVWFPAQWPETYSYTLSACLEVGLPIVAPSIGAFAERLHGRAWSWVRPWNSSAKEWVGFFEAIRAQHFITGQSPELAAASEGALPSKAAWSYGDEYPSTTWQGTQAIDVQAASLQPYLQKQSSMDQNAKSIVLDVLVYLRSSWLFRGFAKHIPLRWQTKIKNWLRA